MLPDQINSSIIYTGQSPALGGLATEVAMTSNSKGETMEKIVRHAMLLVAAIVSAMFLYEASMYKLNMFRNNTETVTITAEQRERQLECLARNIYHEAGNEPFEGKVAVAQVTINRSESGKFPPDICRVVYQKNVFMERVVCQFSWYCETGPKTRPIHSRTYDESYTVAKKVLLEGFRLPSLTEAMYYHADYVNPKWNKEKITKIGRHIFYKDT